MIKRSVSAFLLSIGLLLLSLPAYSQSQTDYQTALAHWSRVLAHYVNEQGQIDFIALAKQPADLQHYVDFVAKVSPDTAPELFTNPSQLMAYHINTYNALAMYGVIEQDIPADFDSFFKRFMFFKFRDVVIGGRTTSLYDYENKVIRPLGEPRVHFALNCMVKDCPRLPNTPFVADRLELKLQQATMEFFNKSKHLYIDHENERVFVSEILDFYTEDFVTSGKPQDLLPYINQYRSITIPSHYQVDFIEYDWTLNQQP